MTQQTQSESSEAPAETEESGWRSAIAPEYRKVAEKFLTPADVVRSYAELERKLGSAIAVPGEGADDAERDRFYERLGRPKRVEDYSIEVPAGLPEALRPDESGLALQNRFLEQAHRAGLTRGQAQAAVDWYYGELARGHSDVERSSGEGVAETDAALRAEWGRDYDRNIEYGRRAMAQFGEVDAVDRMEEVMGTPHVLRMMSRIGRALGEAGTVSVGAGHVRTSGLRQELDSLMKSDDYWSNRKTQQRVRDIHAEMYGGRSIVGENGRGF